jgi:hypothetical protein
MSISKIKIESTDFIPLDANNITGLSLGYADGGNTAVSGSFTVVSDESLAVDEPIRSNDIISIKNNTLFLFDASIGFPIIDQQRFDASGTWTKPTINTPEAATLVVLLVGGGGAGGRSNFDAGSAGSGAGGGGTGGVAFSVMPFDLANATATVTIGSGAAGESTTSGTSDRSTGNNGGASSFVMTDGSVTANGGFGGETYPDGVGFGHGRGGNRGEVARTGVFPIVVNYGKNGRWAVQFNDAASLQAQPLFSGGGAAARNNSQVFTINNAGGPAFSIVSLNNEPFLGAGGTGSTTTAVSGGAWGAGGGGAAGVGNGVVTSGGGGNGGCLAFVVRGVISLEAFNNKYINLA